MSEEEVYTNPMEMDNLSRFRKIQGAVYQQLNMVPEMHFFTDKSKGVAMADYSRQKTCGLFGSINKVSQGNWTDSRWEEHYIGDLGAGMAVGGYHFIDSRFTPEENMTTFHTEMMRVTDGNFHFPPVLDMELWNLEASFVLECKQIAESLFGMPTMLYTGVSVWNSLVEDVDMSIFRNWEYWIAGYLNSLANPKLSCSDYESRIRSVYGPGYPSTPKGLNRANMKAWQVAKNVDMPSFGSNSDSGQGPTTFNGDLSVWYGPHPVPPEIPEPPIEPPIEPPEEGEMEELLNQLEKMNASLEAMIDVFSKQTNILRQQKNAIRSIEEKLGDGSPPPNGGTPPSPNKFSSVMVTTGTANLRMFLEKNDAGRYRSQMVDNEDRGHETQEYQDETVVLYTKAGDAGALDPNGNPITDIEVDTDGESDNHVYMTTTPIPQWVYEKYPGPQDKGPLVPYWGIRIRDTNKNPIPWNPNS